MDYILIWYRIDMVHHKYGKPYYHIYSSEYAPKMRAERYSHKIDNDF